MKRDLDLIRKILLAMEAQEHGTVQGDIQIDGYTEEKIGFHVYLFGEAGLAKVADCTYLESRSLNAIPLNITWAGYEFLDAAKDERLWGKAKIHVIKPAGGVAFGVLVDWLRQKQKFVLACRYDSERP